MGQQHSLNSTTTSTICSQLEGKSGDDLYRELLTDIQSIATDEKGIIELLGTYYNTDPYNENWQLRVISGNIPVTEITPALIESKLRHPLVNPTYDTQPGTKPLNGWGKACDTSAGLQYGFMSYNVSFYGEFGNTSWYLMIYTPADVSINTEEPWKLNLVIRGFQHCCTYDSRCTTVQLTAEIPSLTQEAFNKFITSTTHPKAAKWRALGCYCGDSIPANSYLEELFVTAGYKGTKDGGTAACDTFFTDEWCVDPTGKPECACISSDLTNLTDDQKVLKTYVTSLGQDCPQLYSSECATHGYKTAELKNIACPTTCMEAINTDSGNSASVSVEGNTVQISCNENTEGSVDLSVVSTCSPACADGGDCIDGKCPGESSDGTGTGDGTGDTGTGTGDGTGEGGDGTGDGTSDSSSQNFWEKIEAEWNKLDKTNKIIAGVSAGVIVVGLIVLLAVVASGKKNRR